MNKVSIMKNNKGASLVMVLLAMMFVGIIAAIALTLTVGNAKSSKATIDTSKNFYSTESILDDLEMYLKKLATDAATNAYASSLTKLGTPGLDIEDDFEATFAANLLSILGGAGSTSGEISGNVGPNNTFNLNLLQQVCYDRYGLITNASEYSGSGSGTIPITIRYDSIVTDPVDGYTKIKGLVITLKDENGFESTITTDITFKAKMPTSSSVDSAGDFSYGIDHYVVIAGQNITSQGSNKRISGTYTGNIYANKDFLVLSGSGETRNLKLKSNYVVIGGDIILDNVDSGEKGTLKVDPVGNNKIIPYASSANVFADDFKVYDGDFTGTGLNTYLQGGLEINGNTGSFIASGTDFIGYTSAGSGETYIVTAADSTKTVDQVKPKSSAIVLNGLGAKLDLSHVGTVKLMGTAYTTMSDLKGVSDAYSSYNAPATSNLYYFTQGESITYRALQALYLIPGNRIRDVGHNPMSVSEYNAALASGSGELAIDSTNITGLQAKVYKEQKIRHVGSGSGASTDGQVYVFWNFNSVPSAVSYFTTIIDQGLDTDYFSGHDLSNSKIKMLYDKHGYIKLPSSGSGVLTKGNSITYSSSSGLQTKSGGVDQDMTSYKNRYGNLKGSVTDNQSTAPSNTKNLLENIFPKVIEGSVEKDWLDVVLLDAGEKVYNVKSPLGEIVSGENQYTDDAGNIIKCTLQDPTNAYDQMLASQSYKLVTSKGNIIWGDDSGESWSANTTYIFVAGGDVTIQATHTSPVRAMIIAEGNVYLPDGLTLECLGMMNYKAEQITGGSQLIYDYDEELTEFGALLRLCVNGDSDYLSDNTTVNGNTLLRKIFNIANTSGSGGSGNGNDFVTLETTEWKRN